MLKRTLLAAALIGFTGVAIADGHGEKPHANPWSNFSLDNTLQSMPAGDATRGQSLHSQMMCNSCHGENGESPSRNYASINGQPAEYTVKMMLDYRDGRRWEDYKQANIMVKLAQALDDQQIADLAAFYAQGSTQAWGYTKPLDQDMHNKVDHLVRKGDFGRMITPCASCHGAKGEGNEIAPALAGQVPEYFVRTMQAYKDGARHNDVNEGMSQFTHDLTDAEIEALAEYYASLNKQ
ncbi:MULTISPECIES: c-type cytochrome [Thiomicrorhabdus]|uniref:Cytochrome c4 n=1 Tax=Thiomicrorhabdus heinhorstiae TaxID=2748010 RepID=A0ABS0BU43_9GAMM|nr:MULTISPECIES: c-type cytochrome [Thiomicrorhabdus]MBF6057363.1 cytochrome c4 [Thiomicrorhabdus heinhorstiae]